MTRGLDLTGQTFGRLTAIERTAQRMNGSIVWRCACACGTVKLIGAAELQHNKTRSCGCLHRESSAKQARRIDNRKHGHRAANSPTYISWQAMRKRTNDPTRKYYGADGVKVCARWHTFETFLADMGERPPGTTLDRFPNPAGDYEPDNCRWATGPEQRSNRRT